ncbi:dihydrofolate reductase family protein [Nocardioides nanhaiensis]|uniref:Dihydrofolate reductase family protein n=1 Tax=Nocardioides nanhaiensis TaxID=1476871 RepID=A0ABP8VT46_9ACTN
MRTLAITQNITLDGRIEMLDDWFDGAAQGDAGHEEQLAENARQRQRADALLVGRRTFEDFRHSWRALADDATGISDYLDGVRKHVVSSTLDEADLDWAGSSVLRGDPVAAVQELKARPGGDIVCTGSIRLTHTLVAAGVVDEYRLFVYPVVQGRGQGLFPEGHSASGLRLTEARAFGNGVGYLRYRAG